MNDNVIIRVNNTNSTNNLLRNYNGEKGTLTIATADYQTNGRGQGNNSWESEEGKNILYSILAYPNNLPANRQFVMLEAQALAIKEVMDNLLISAKCHNDISDHNDISNHNTPITIKWPNDIYYKDCKLSGTRIDLNLQGMKIQDMVIGTGVNVNQLQFTGTAPNPVSLSQISGLTYSLSQILSSIIDAFERNYALLRSGAEQYIIRCYHEHLYRRVGMYRYRDIHGEFQAEMVGVASNGILTLRRADGTLSKYEFKELSIVL